MPRLIDLSQILSGDTPVFPGDQVPYLAPRSDSSEGWVQYELRTGLHCGTHVDAPRHRFPAASQISDIALERFTGHGVLVDARGVAEAPAALLSNRTALRDAVVLVLTGFSSVFGSPEYFHSYPTVSEEFAEVLVESGVRCLGIDGPSPDREPYPVHDKLLRSGVLLLENLTNLEQLLGIDSFEVFAVPPRIAAEASPVRVFARVPI